MTKINVGKSTSNTSSRGLSKNVYGRLKWLCPEQERQQQADDMLANHGPHWAEQYKPGSFGCHELLDRTSLAADLVEQYVLSHPACVQNRDWFALAEQAVAALRELYQQVGAEHVDNQSNGTNNP